MLRGRWAIIARNVRSSRLMTRDGRISTDDDRQKNPNEPCNCTYQSIVYYGHVVSSSRLSAREREIMRAMCAAAYRVIHLLQLISGEKEREEEEKTNRRADTYIDSTMHHLSLRR